MRSLIPLEQVSLPDSDRGVPAADCSCSGGGTMNRTLRTGEVAERAGVNAQTLRYYERRGLIATPQRSPGGHRAYPAETVPLIGVIKGAQRLGFTLDEIADLLATGQRTHPTPDLQQRARAKLSEIDQKLRDLTLIRNTLNEVITAHCDSLIACSCPDCPLPFAGLAQLPELAVRAEGDTT